ncbi:MAG: SsrA-binding protein SmpB [Planctomycetes bacterium]|nr:SsrA-binding protein SmpB [Planctomycetota bacterium]
MPQDDIKPIARNRKAFHNFLVFDKWEAGIELRGTEVKSLRNGQVQMGDSYARIEDGQAFLIGLHISPYAKTAYGNHDPLRKRRLLLHHREIRRLATKVNERGFTLIPISLYFKRGLAKVELALACGKKLHDKRQDIKKREHQRQIQRATSPRR